MSRLSFRPRPLDVNKKLRLLRTPEDFEEDEDGRAQLLLDVETEEVLARPTRSNKANSHTTNVKNAGHVKPNKAGGLAKDIPTPRFEVVDSYNVDYPATFRQPSSYVRSKPARSEAGVFVEYDLDDDDDEWLASYNQGRMILPPEKFEWMLYRLEILDAKTRERAGIGGTALTLGNPVPVLLQREQAYEALRSQEPSERLALLAAVFDYWSKKREVWQKPLLRRLQPPPSLNDTNPFNVFRPREKVHRPHTRRVRGSCMPCHFQGVA
eukprot:TRINITY_DN6840_c0_g2_i2.p1 TRINITY_DN6840_c0_g2~~TRINITY_DN6840_c0_g2_i2.p1  ORF type:complete len:267 (+),score=31.28 TRINITY_DN6840_c0_g2_i2:243-1043(+)